MAPHRGFDVVALRRARHRSRDRSRALRADGQPCFAPKPGGAPGNVAVGVARLGGRAAMLSKVGAEAVRPAPAQHRSPATASPPEGVLTTRAGQHARSPSSRSRRTATATSCSIATARAPTRPIAPAEVADGHHPRRPRPACRQPVPGRAAFRRRAAPRTCERRAKRASSSPSTSTCDRRCGGTTQEMRAVALEGGGGGRYPQGQ